MPIDPRLLAQALQNIQLKGHDFKPDDSVVLSSIYHPLTALGKAADWTTANVDTAMGVRRPENYDEALPIEMQRGYAPEQRQEAAFNLAGLAGTGSLPFAPKSAGGLLGTAAKPAKAAKSKLTEFEKAHLTAQKNAALPVEQGGLGLPPDNTAMDRARAMGFDVDTPLYHGTADDFSAFSNKKLGVNTSDITPASNILHFTTDNPDYAGDYAKYAANFSDNPSENIMPLLVKNENPLYTSEADLRDFIGDFSANTAKSKLKKEGYTGVFYDTSMGSENGVFDPKNIRSVNAAFDSKKRNSANILASAAGAGVLAGTLSDNSEAAQTMEARPVQSSLGQLEQAMRRAYDLGDMETAKIIAQAYKDKKSQIATPEPLPPLDNPSTLVGIGKGMAEGVRGVTDLIGAKDPIGSYPPADKAIDENAWGGRFIGNVAMTMPTMFIPGANTVTGGALIGAGSNYLLNAGDQQDRLEHAGVGAIGGAAGALIVNKALPYVARLADVATAPFRSEAGKNQVLARMLKRVVGDNAPEVAARLESPQILVSGTQPTAAEIAKSGGVSALQRYAEQANPENYTFRRGQNADARADALRSIAKGDAERAAAVDFREAKAAPLYDAAKSQAVQIDDTLKGLLSRPSMATALGHAEQIAAEQGRPLDPAIRAFIESGNGAAEIPGEVLHHLKIGLDAAAKDPKNPLTGAQQRALQGTIKEFEAWREAAIPDYAKAQNLYKRLSRPINQMDIGQELYSKAKPAITDYGNTTHETAQNLARALRDGDVTAQRATGQKSATLDKVLTKRQKALAENVAMDMARKVEADSLGRGIGSNTFQNFAMRDMAEASGMPGKILGAVIKKVPLVGGAIHAGGVAATKNAQEEMHQMLADVLLNPQKTAALLRMQSQAGLPEWMLNSGLSASPALIGSVLANRIKQEGDNAKR